MAWRAGRLLTALVELVSPPLCVVCRAPAGQHLCEACIAAMPRVQSPFCPLCGRALDPVMPRLHRGAGGRLVCRPCAELGAAFAACRCYGLFQGPLREAIHAVKYRGRRAAVPALARLLAEALSGSPELRSVRALVPVPLHRTRLRERGFNQAELLARALSEDAGLPVYCDLLAKKHQTRPQVGLNAAERRENVKGAFEVRPGAVPQGSLLLVDDVVTTGATFHECASALRAAGSGPVYALALARD